MIVDSSALVAILRREPEADHFLRLVTESDTVRISAATYLEAAIVVDLRRDPTLRREFDDALLAVQEDGEFDRLKQKWFGSA